MVGPLPVGDGGDVGAVLTGVLTGMQAGVLQFLPQLRVAGGQARDVVEDVDREPVPVGVVVVPRSWKPCTCRFWCPARL